MERLARDGERFDLVAGASSGSVCAAVTVAGLSREGPRMWRELASTPIFGARYLQQEKSPFGMSVILRAALERFLPERMLQGTDAELLVATTRARALAAEAVTYAKQRPRAEPPTRLAGALAVHSNRARRDMHDVIVASCYIPVVYARLPRLDGEVHVDGGAADNTLLDELAARGADEITLVTPYTEGRVASTLFSPERLPKPPPGVRLRVLYPERMLSQKRFDFSPGPLEEALTMPHRERVL
jgi:NTE family protein